jgi:hypothetical protein
MPYEVTTLTILARPIAAVRRRIVVQDIARA